MKSMKHFVDPFYEESYYPLESPLESPLEPVRSGIAPRRFKEGTWPCKNVEPFSDPWRSWRL